MKKEGHVALMLFIMLCTFVRSHQGAVVCSTEISNVGKIQPVMNFTGVPVIPINTQYTLCEIFTIQVQFTSFDADEVFPEIIGLNNIPAGLAMGPCVVSVPCNGAATASVTLSQTTSMNFEYAWMFNQGDLNTLGVNGLESGECLLVTIEFRPHCDYNGLLPDVTMAGIDVNQDLVSATVNMNYTMTWSGLDICNPSCMCETASIRSASQGPCEYEFTAAITPYLCAFTQINWDFGDGTYGTGSPVTHQYTTEGMYQVCYTFYCFADSGIIRDSCFVCDSIYIDCGGDTTCLRIENAKDGESGEAIIATPDGGCAIVGNIFPNPTNLDEDMYFVKYDNDLDGSTAIGKIIGGLDPDKAYSLVFRKNDGYYIAGETNPATGGTEVYIAKLSTAGNLLWARRYSFGVNTRSSARKIIDISTLNSDLLLVTGYTSFGGLRNVFAITINSNGFVQGSRIYSGPGASVDVGWDMVKYIDRGNQYIFIVGDRKTPVSNDAFILKIDANLNLLNSRIINVESRDEFAEGIAIIPDANGATLYMVGSIFMNPGSNPELYIFRMNTDLLPTGNPTNIILDNPGHNIYEAGVKIKVTKNNDLIIAAENGNDSGVDFDGLLLRLDHTTLAPIWSMTTGRGGLNETYRDIIELNNGYLVATGSYNVSPGNADIFMTKLNSKGESCCVEPISFHSEFSFVADLNFREDPVVVTYHRYGTMVDWYKDAPICPDVNGHLRKEESSGTKLSQNLNLYPNPSTGEINIELPDARVGNVDVTVHDITGRAILHKNFDSSQTIYNINIGNTQNGIYFINVTCEGQSWCSKIVIQK